MTNQESCVQITISSGVTPRLKRRIYLPEYTAANIPLPTHPVKSAYKRTSISMKSMLSYDSYLYLLIMHRTISVLFKMKDSFT